MRGQPSKKMLKIQSCSKIVCRWYRSEIKLFRLPCVVVVISIESVVFSSSTWVVATVEEQLVTGTKKKKSISYLSRKCSYPHSFGNRSHSLEHFRMIECHLTDIIHWTSNKFLCHQNRRPSDNCFHTHIPKYMIGSMHLPTMKYYEERHKKKQVDRLLIDVFLPR